jgi:hypothetical protein
MVWEVVFLLLVLKIPLVYLCWVVWWAIRSEPAPPEPLEGAVVPAYDGPGPRPGWRFLRRPDRPRRPTPQRGPRRAPRRAYGRAPLPASWLASGWKEGT